MSEVLDKVGQEIKSGSIIAYGHALGRCAGIRIGKVLAVKHEQVKQPIWGNVLPGTEKYNIRDITKLLSGA